MVKDIILVGLGGAIGSILRYSASFLFKSPGFPFTTLAINVTGSFLIGVFITLFNKGELEFNAGKLFIITGICGGFTTFSAFSLENMQLIKEGKSGMAIIYILLSVFLSLAAVFVGYKISITGK